MINERGITIKELMDFDIMEKGSIAAGERGMGKVITGVNIMEVPDILDWVKPGELLITTAYSIKDDMKAQQELVPRLHKKGLAGLAIKTKRYLERIPQIMIDEGNKLGFPIVEIPYDIPFPDLMNAILMEIYSKQADVLMRMDEIHQKITEVVLFGGGLKEIGNTLYDIIKNPMVIRDNIFCKSVPIASEEEKKILTKEIRKTINSDYISCHVDEDISKEGKFIFPIIAGKRIYGEIHIWELAKKINAVDIRAVQYACTVAALELMKQITIFEVESRHRNEFIEGLLSLDENVRASAIKQLDVFGLDMDRQFVVLLIYIEDLETYFYDNPQSNGTQYKNRLIKTIEDAVAGKNVRILSGSKGNTLTMVAAFRQNGEDKCTKEKNINMMRQIIEAIKRNYSNISLFAGMGRCYYDINELWKSYEEAKKSLSFARIFKNDSIIHYDNLGIFRLLCMEHQENEINKFYKEMIEPLKEYDEQKGGELIKTLQMYYECGGNLKKVSEKMYIHYNTILYRIQKIQQITNMNLSNPNDRLNLEVSLKIMSIIKDAAFHE